MNADSIVLGSNGREQPDNVDRRVLPQRLQRERAVLPAAPAEDDLFDSELGQKPVTLVGGFGAGLLPS
jgi:hypothetical protein